jgi:hypothetical protein
MPNLGKNTSLLMYDFSIKNIGNIVVGDWLRGDDEIPREVVGITYTSGVMYEVEQSFGTTYTVAANSNLCLSNFTTNHRIECDLKTLMENNIMLENYGGFRHNLESISIHDGVNEVCTKDIRDKMFTLRCPYTITNHVVFIRAINFEDIPISYPITVKPISHQESIYLHTNQNGRILLKDATVVC